MRTLDGCPARSIESQRCVEAEPHNSSTSNRSVDDSHHCHLWITIASVDVNFCSQAVTSPVRRYPTQGGNMGPQSDMTASDTQQCRTSAIVAPVLGKLDRSTVSWHSGRGWIRSPRSWMEAPHGQEVSRPDGRQSFLNTSVRPDSRPQCSGRRRLTSTAVQLPCEADSHPTMK